MKKIIINGLLVFWTVSPLFGQLFGLPHLERYTQSEGLSNNSIMDIQQDSIGFLWVATADGLNRFDGYSFNVYRKDNANRYSLTENWLHSILPSQDGQLWVGTQKEGLCKYDYSIDGFRSIRIDSQVIRSDHYLNLGNTIFEADSNRIWLGMSPGIVEIQLGADTICTLFSKEEDNFGTNAFYRDQDGTIWIGTNLGLFTIKEGASREMEPVSSLTVAQTGPVQAIINDHSGHLLVGAEKGLFYLNFNAAAALPEKKDWGRLSRFTQITALVCDRKGRIWVGSRSGLGIIDAPPFQTTIQAADILAKNKLNLQYINDLFLDREDNLWIGTASSGLLRLFLSEKHFPLFRPSETVLEAGSLNNITSAFMDPDSIIWLGTYGGGLIRFDRKTMSYNVYRADVNDPTALSNNTNYAIYRDHAGTLWVGSWFGGGINQVVENGTQLRFIHHEANNRETPDPSAESYAIQQIFEDEYLNLWVATNSGILKKGKTEQTFREIYSFDLPYVSINSILEDEAGNWWIGTWNGLFRYGRSKIQQIKKDQAQTPIAPDASYYSSNSTLNNNRITCLHQDSKGNIWVGTYGGGLNRWTGDADGTPSFEILSQKDGLLNDVIYGILEDRKGRLWFSTNHGLVLFEADNGAIQAFTSMEGLQSNQFNLHAFNYTPDSNFIFGGVNGFNLFDPLKFSSQSSLPPKVLITDFKLKGVSLPIGSTNAGVSMLGQSILVTDEVRLLPGDNNFLIQFTSPTYNDAYKLKYAYQLVGFDEDWHYQNYTNRSVVFANLREGKYTFKLKASADGQNWSPERHLRITIAPPWYRTWWAYSLMGLLLLLIFLTAIWITYQYSNLQNRLQFEQLRRHKEAEANEMRQWFYTYISHEFRTPLTLIISPLKELLKDEKLSQKIREQLHMPYLNSKRLLRLVKQILHFRMANSGQLDLKVARHDLVAFSKTVFQSFSAHAEERNIRYSMHAESEAIPLWFDEEKMELVLYNLLSNAFKFSNDRGTIKLILQDGPEDSVTIIIEDKGIGMPPYLIPKIFTPFYRSTDTLFAGSGIGLALVKNLVELHYGRIDVQSEPGKGSMFQVFLLKGNAHFKEEELTETHSSVDGEQLLDAVILPEPEAAGTAILFPQLAGKEKPQLLIVEDDKAILSYFHDYFNPYFQVIEAQNGEEGLQLARKFVPDMVISDLMMPVMDGITFCKQLKSRVDTSHIPVILLTAKTSMTKQLEGFESGALEYITKPVDMTLLKSRVFAVMKNVLRLREHYKHISVLPSATNQSSAEEKFLLAAAQCVEEHLADTDFNAEVFATKMQLSRSSLHRKLTALTGKSTTQFIRYIRLKHAERLLREGHYNISQTAYHVGFSDLKYFRKCFKEEFGDTPSGFLKRLGEKAV